jgi:hypothetical protein
MEGRLYLLNWYKGRRSWETDVYPRIEAILTQKGLNVSCPDNLTKDRIANLRSLLNPGDVVVCHQPDIAIHTPCSPCFCEPAGIPLRNQQLSFLERHGLSVMDWADPLKDENPVTLFEKWRTDELLLKRSHSSQSTGLVVIRKGQPFPELKHGDVLCKIITHDPQTYKVDFFYDTILGSYVKETPSILDPQFPEWIAGDNRDQRDFPHQNRRFFQLPGDLEADIRKLGRVIISIGGGYSSIDLMKDRDGFRIIELNTSNISTKYGWLERPGQYSMNFAEGLSRLWDQISARG